MLSHAAAWCSEQFATFLIVIGAPRLGTDAHCAPHHRNGLPVIAALFGQPRLARDSETQEAVIAAMARHVSPETFTSNLSSDFVRNTKPTDS